MEWLVVLLVVVAAAAVVVWYLKHRQDERRKQARPPEDVIGDVDKPSADQLRMLAVGDVIDHHGQQWFVRGRLDFDEHGYRWAEHLLDDASTRRWLCVEDDEGFEVSLWQGIADGDIEQGSPGDRDVIAGAVAYRLQEQGTATFAGEGSTGTAESGSCRYADYKSADGKLLGFENYGGRWEASLGETLQPWELTVFPSTDRPGSL